MHTFIIVTDRRLPLYLKDGKIQVDYLNSIFRKSIQAIFIPCTTYKQ